LHKVGYAPLKGTARNAKGKERDNAAVIIPKAPHLDPNAFETLKAIPAVARAAKKLNEADRALEEALARGETWEGTEVPEEMRWGCESLKGLEYMRIYPEDMVTDGPSTESGSASSSNAKPIVTRRTRSQAAAANTSTSGTATTPPSTLSLRTSPAGTDSIHEGDVEMANSAEAECTPSPTTSSSESSGSSYIDSSASLRGRRKRKTPDTELSEEKEEDAPPVGARSKRVRRAPKRMA
jgi:hypothetical protein